MTDETFTPLKGHCTCRAITYEVLAPFLCTNCCHCTWCQRETGSAFVLNAIIETSNFRITSDTKPIHVDVPSASGDGQMMARCPKCFIVLYGDYADDGTWTTYVRVGTLDDESKERTKPDVHIFTSTKMDWVDLSGEKARGVPIFEESYRRIHVWRNDANERFDLLKIRMEESKKEEEVEEKVSN
ncbi:Mss4-like protein [Clohesyomyces aquaticus]|uniref:Mss4-like protein n=1 Tax=Clohesyomyces aquaticus TaxID=1231657 RepID=A0A1Y1ZI21_9PLEO|nr:Mss4-like protein [Clohesyomyces aquaticus]